MKCKNCGCEDFTMMTTMIVSFPLEWQGRLTKRKMTKKEFKVWGVNWDLSDIICKNCGYVIFSRKEKESISLEELEEVKKKIKNYKHGNGNMFTSGLNKAIEILNELIIKKKHK